MHFLFCKLQKKILFLRNTYKYFTIFLWRMNIYPNRQAPAIFQKHLSKATRSQELWTVHTLSLYLFSLHPWLGFQASMDVIKLWYAFSCLNTAVLLQYNAFLFSPKSLLTILAFAWSSFNGFLVLLCIVLGYHFFFQDFQGFLNDLQDWELSVKDKDKKMKKPQASDKVKVSIFLLVMPQKISRLFIKCETLNSSG